MVFTDHRQRVVRTLRSGGSAAQVPRNVWDSNLIAGRWTCLGSSAIEAADKVAGPRAIGPVVRNNERDDRRQRCRTSPAPPAHGGGREQRLPRLRDWKIDCAKTGGGGGKDRRSRTSLSFCFKTILVFGDTHQSNPPSMLGHTEIGKKA